MVLSDLGITKLDFENFAFADLSREVIRIPIIKTISNATGSPTYSEGTSETIRAIFTKKTTKYDFNKEGLAELGDAFMQILETQDLNKEDLIIVDNEKFRVDEILIRVPGGDRFFKSVILFKVE